MLSVKYIYKLANPRRKDFFLNSNENEKSSFRGNSSPTTRLTCIYKLAPVSTKVFFIHSNVLKNTLIRIANQSTLFFHILQFPCSCFFQFSIVSCSLANSLLSNQSCNSLPVERQQKAKNKTIKIFQFMIVKRFFFNILSLQIIPFTFFNP